MDSQNMYLNTATNLYTHTPLIFCKQDLVHPFYSHWHWWLYYIALYGASDSFIQPDDGLIRNGRNM